MPRNGAGVYSLPAGNPVVTLTQITTAWANGTMSDIATALTNSIAKNGVTAPTANLPMAGFKHTGAGVAAVAGEYVTFNQTGVQFPVIGIGTASSPWDYPALDLSTTGAVWGSTNSVAIGYNTYTEGADTKAKTTDVGGLLAVNSTGLVFLTAPSVTVGSVQTFASQFGISLIGQQSLPHNSCVQARTNFGFYTVFNSTPVQMAFGVEDMDIHGDFASNVFTAPESGVYHLHYHGNASKGTTYAAIQLRVNGTSPASLGSTASVGSTQSLIEVDSWYSLTVGDIVSVWMVSDAALGQNAVYYDAVFRARRIQ